MFLEKCGQLFFLRIRPVFFFALIVLPLIFVSIVLSHQSNELQDLEERFRKALRKERIALEKKGRKERFLKRYSNVNPYFIDQQIESIPLLQKERQKLTSLLNHPAFPESSDIRERLQFLDHNRLLFTEGKIEVSSQMKEVEEKQKHRVQMDAADLKRVLSLVEDLSIDTFSPTLQSPQLLIKELHIKKQQTPLHTEVFEVDMDLIKREFFQP